MNEYGKWCGVKTEFWKQGVVIQPNFLSAAECDKYCQSVLALDRTIGLPLIERQVRERSLRYKVVDGLKIADAIPEIDDVTERVESALDEVCGPGLRLMEDSVASRNVNVTPPGGEYRWHYDRNAVTAILYLNEVPGGETEVFANYRLLLRRGRHQRTQQRLDDLLRLRLVRRLFGHQRLIVPHKGTMVIMRGNTTMHSVRAVLGTEDRIAAVLSFDYPGGDSQRAALNDYLYTSAKPKDGDPNYKA
jgi:2OG-Fe(II) oxygenase superfamily